MNQMGKYYEEFEIAQIIEHSLRKTILESDNNIFSLLTMNHHPLHLDMEYCKMQKYGKILVVGTYVFSIVVGFTVADISGKAIANLSYEKIEHNNPVFIGDTLRAETVILDKRESKSNNKLGIIYVETKAFNQKDELVLTFRRNVLIAKKEK